jgi:hypothetical protein
LCSYLANIWGVNELTEKDIQMSERENNEIEGRKKKYRSKES